MISGCHMKHVSGQGSVLGLANESTAPFIFLLRLPTSTKWEIFKPMTMRLKETQRKLLLRKSSGHPHDIQKWMEEEVTVWS